jgi:hypothetical protein|tara:strand:+ start:23 stop:193 length:171 start_codon:yes stop_codon:yes gene_type:complete
MTQYDVFPEYRKRIDGNKVTSIHVDKGELTTRYADGTMSIETKQPNGKWKLTRKRK